VIWLGSQGERVQGRPDRSADRSTRGRAVVDARPDPLLRPRACVTNAGQAGRRSAEV